MEGKAGGTAERAHDGALLIAGAPRELARLRLRHSRMVSVETPRRLARKSELSCGRAISPCARSSRAGLVRKDECQRFLPAEWRASPSRRARAVIAPRAAYQRRLATKQPRQFRASGRAGIVRMTRRHDIPCRLGLDGATGTEDASVKVSQTIASMLMPSFSGPRNAAPGR